MKIEPNYYAMIPANVRYDKNLKANEKLMYGEITALTNKTGECWATNNYFANLYGVHKNVVSGWISSLEKQGYLTKKIIYKENSNEIDKRILCINLKVNSINEKIDTPLNEKIKDNSTSMNSTSMNNKENIIKENSEKSEIQKNKFGSFENILLSEIELEKLKEFYDDKLDEAIEFLSESIEARGYKYKSHYAVLGKRQWVYKHIFEAKQEIKQYKQNKSYDRDKDYSYIPF